MPIFNQSAFEDERREQQHNKNMSANQTAITATPAELAAAFAEWERRYRQEPERFMSEATKLINTTPQSCGEFCAQYFIKLLTEKQ